MTALSQDPPVPDWAQPEDDNDWSYMTPEVAGAELVDFLIVLKLSAVLTATQACLIAWWAAQAGATGDCQKLGGVRPGAGSGKYSYEFDKFVGTYPKDLPAYSVRLGERTRHDASRYFEGIPTIPPHEALDREFQRTDEPSAALRRAKHADDLPLVYKTHPWVTAAGETDIHPYCLYMDGVQYNKMDTYVGFWCYFMLTGTRHLLAVLRRSELGSCGCKGWCSLWPIFGMIKWSMQCMYRGIWPTMRHDGQAWSESDAERAAKADSQLGWRGGGPFKGDWSEYCHSLGLASWADSISPCPFCFCGPTEMHTTMGLSAFGGPHPAKDGRHYDAACRNCEVEVTLSAADLRTLRTSLDYDKRKAGSAGRALLVDMPHLGLQKGDRVEPSELFRDIDAVESLQAPCRLRLWRRTAETQTRHRNPLFDEGTGLTIQSVGIDWMHTISLGVVHVLMQNLVWALIGADAWRVGGPFQNALELSVGRLRGELFEWYREEQAANRDHSRVQQMLPSLFGTRSEPAFKFKAAESNGFLFFGASVGGAWECVGRRAARIYGSCAQLDPHRPDLQEVPHEGPTSRHAMLRGRCLDPHAVLGAARHRAEAQTPFLDRDGCQVPWSSIHRHSTGR